MGGGEPHATADDTHPAASSSFLLDPSVGFTCDEREAVSAAGRSLRQRMTAAAKSSEKTACPSSVGLPPESETMRSCSC